MSIIQHLGKRTQLVKIDLKDVYCNIPVYPQDHHLLNIQWNNQVFVDHNLPFELRSVPMVFTAFADLVARPSTAGGGGVHWLLHYLDDFILFGAPGILKVASTAAMAMEVLVNASIPVVPTRLKVHPQL